MSVIKISSSDELPLGLLSNHYLHDFNLDGKTWKSVSHYIYYNLIPYFYKDYAHSLLNIKNPKFLYYEFMKLSKIIYNLEYIKLLEQALREKFKNPTYAKYLMNTGDAKLYYQNKHNLLLGTNFKYENELTNMLGKILEKIRPEIRQNYNENLLYKPYLTLTVLDTVFQSNENVSKYISMLDNQENVTFDSIIDEYGSNKIKTKIPFDFISLINNENDELPKILKLSLKKPVILIFYVLKRYLRKYTQRMQLKVNDIIFETYVNNILSKSNNPEITRNELNYVKNHKIKEVVCDMFYNDLFDNDLNNEINKNIEDIDITSEEDITYFEQFDILKNFEDSDKEEKLPSSKQKYIFDDSDFYLSIFKETMVETEFKLNEYRYNEQTKKVEIVKDYTRTYKTIDEYIRFSMHNILYMSPYIDNDVNYKNKKEELLAKALNFKFGQINVKTKFQKYVYDFQHVLTNLCKNRDIIFIDDDLDIGCQYVKNFKEGDNLLGQYLMKFCKEINVEENNSIYNITSNYNMSEFIENDIFMKQWMVSQVEYIMCIIINIVSYMKSRKDKDIEIDIKITNNILHNILRSKMVPDDKILKVPNFFYDIIRQKSHKFSNFKFTEIGYVVSIIWQYITDNILSLKTDNQHKIKLAIYKMELILSSKQVCIGMGKIKESITENDIDDCICLAIFSLINSMKKIHNINITDIDKDEINCIESILLKKYNKIEHVEKIENKEEIYDNLEHEDDEEEGDEDDETYEDGGRFKKYAVNDNGDCFYLAIYNSLKRTSDGKYLKLFVKCLKKKYDVSINTTREDSFTDDLRKITADNINIEVFYNSLKEIKEEQDADENIKNMSRSFAKPIKKIVRKYFIDIYNDSEENKALFIDEIKTHIKTPRNWVSGDLEVVFLVDLLENCGINTQIQKNKINFVKSKEDNTIYLLNNNETHYEFVLWKEDENEEQNNEINITRDIKKDINHEQGLSRESSKEISEIFNPEDIIKQYFENETEEETEIKQFSDKRQISILSIYFKKHKIDIDPKAISEIINTFKFSKISTLIKYARINFFVFKNFIPEIKEQNKVEKINMSKLKWLFKDKNLKGETINLNNLKLTKESLYSITPWIEADHVTKKIIKYISKPVNEIVITDATANVGGNSISLYNHGIKNVNSVEIDKLTCDHLKHNLDVYGYDTNNVICDDYLNVKNSLEQDCVFFDPPWGGKDYTNVKILDLYLDRTNIVDIIFDLFTDSKATLIVLKVPLNYNHQNIELVLKKLCDLEKEIIKRNGKPSYYIYYISTNYKKLVNPEYEKMQEYDPMNPDYDYKKPMSEEMYDPMNPWM